MYNSIIIILKWFVNKLADIENVPEKRCISEFCIKGRKFAQKCNIGL